MLTRNWKTNQYRAADFVRSVLYLAFFACVVSTGCKSNRTSAKSAEGVSQGAQQLHSADFSGNLGEKLFTANANLGAGGVPFADSTDSRPAQALPRHIQELPEPASVVAMFKLLLRVFLLLRRPIKVRASLQLLGRPSRRLCLISREWPTS